MKNKNLNDELDDLLSSINLPTDEDIKKETTKLILSECGKKTIAQNRRIMSEEKRKLASINGKMLCKNKKGIFGLSKKEKSYYGLLGSINQSKEAKSLGGQIGGKLRMDKGKKVIMIDKISKKIVGRFPAISTAARFLDKRENKIRDVLSGRRKTAYGFIWEYGK